MTEPSDRASSPGVRSGLECSYLSLDDLSPQDKNAWRHLASLRTESAPFLDEVWTRSWINAFSPQEVTAIGAREDDVLVGMALFSVVHDRWNGTPLTILNSVTNDWSYRYEFLAKDDRADIYALLWKTLFSANKWDIICLHWVVEDIPTMTAGIKYANELGWNHAVVTAHPSPWRRLPTNPASWGKGLKSKFKSNLRNRERRLRALGDVSFDVATKEKQLRAAVNVFYELEASGWKGTRGTAISMQGEAKALFDGLLESPHEDIWIPILSVNDRPVAAQFIRVWDDAMFLLKTAYDPEYATYSPGQLITARVMKYGIEAGMRVFDFLGVPMTWKSDWSPEDRPNVVLIFFAPTFAGRYAYWSRYGYKQMVKKIPGAVRTVRWLRTKRKTR